MKSDNKLLQLLGLGVALVAIYMTSPMFNSSSIPEGMFEDPKTGNPMLLGEITVQDLKQDPFSEWYSDEFDTYEVDTELINAIDSPEEYTYEVFLGTWCGDSRREFPRIAKIFNEMGVDINDVLIVTVDRDKISPNREQEGKDIRYVPTLIVSKDNQEIGRIVESPSSEIATLESDLFEITLGIPPIPNYTE